MPLREVLFGVSVATLVPTTLVGSTLATSFHIVETVLGTRLPADGSAARMKTSMTFYDNTFQKAQTCPGEVPGKSKPLRTR
ncbi:putative integrase, catalytic region [Burkholderia pseudomallei MSHR5569]|nr:putative integrase, catalytic region [Burkholderia pseudomallei MSHR5569]